MGFLLCSLAFPSPDHTPRRNHPKERGVLGTPFYSSWGCELQMEQGTSHCGSQDGRSKQMPGPMALSFSPPLHPGPQPIRGTTTAHGSPLLKGSSREGSHRCTQKSASRLLGASQHKVTINIISSQRRRVHRNPKKPLSQHITSPYFGESTLRLHL